ncbi:sulfotransferase family 2 domain-containing protein [Rhodobacteraceae bacterium DSL-40]|uniref:sulfotransferase family 2 domain-containing protein n=1 Tax=Amaricoccus sp. B4 TaxID=3368557 RepID=UPI0013A6EBC4
MSLVDIGKSFSHTLREKLVPQRFVFHHVPKCGGTSVGRALRKRYILSQATVVPESSFRAFEAFTGREDRQQMLIDVLDLREQMMLYHMFEDVRGISLHVRFSNVAHDRFRDLYKFITVLREPVSRFISHYHWSYGKPHAHARIEEDFETFLSTERARRMGATYVEYFCGLPKDESITSDVAIAAAIGNLKRLDVVGNLADLGPFERDIQSALGVRIRIGRENVRKKRPGSQSELDNPALRARIEEICAPDIAVWNAIFPQQVVK